jgi:predicted Zn-dependent protease
VLRLVPDASRSSLEEIALASMRKAGFSLLDGESIRFNGLAAYHGVYDGQQEGGALTRVEAAHIRLGQQVFLLAGIASRERFPETQRNFSDTIRSFAPASEADVAGIRPNRLGFATVQRGDTWQGIAERTGGLISASDLAVLNGFDASTPPPAGRRIKIVIAGD